MSLFSTTWTLKGVSVEARQAAARAASTEGEDLGAWLSRVISKVGEAELNPAGTTEAAAVGNAGDVGDTKLTSIERAMLRPGNRLSSSVSSA